MRKLFVPQMATTVQSDKYIKSYISKKTQTIVVKKNKKIEFILDIMNKNEVRREYYIKNPADSA